jgi:ferrochelatase
MTNGRGEILVMSFHGVPKYTIERGDPYYDHCQTTAKLLAQELGLNEKKYRLGFQSRFGRTEWIQPYITEILADLPGQNIKKIDVVCPGFVSDCLETLEEIAMQEKSTFLKAGGQTYNYIPCLNEYPQWIHTLTSIALDQIRDWVTLADTSQAKTEAQIAWQRNKEKPF